MRVFSLIAMVSGLGVLAGMTPTTHGDRSLSDTRATARSTQVRPGAVSWHEDFAAACEAARQSGKPVLLFQLMGQLDDRFC